MKSVFKNRLGVVGVVDMVEGHQNIHIDSDRIMGKFSLDASSIKGRLVINPEEIFITFKFNLETICKLFMSPGVTKKIILFLSQKFFNLSNSFSLSLARENSL